MSSERAEVGEAGTERAGGPGPGEWEDELRGPVQCQARAAIPPSPNVPPLSPASDPVGLFSLIASHQARGHAR